MRSGAARAMIGLMPGDSVSQPVRLVLALDPAGDPPTGELVDEHGSVTEFSGWLQLMDRVEDARRRAAPDEESSRPHPEIER
jgi:hypothetical protein